MDPISQGVLGAVTAMSFAPAKQVRYAALVGWGSGMLADADVFIRSAEDPLLTIEYHRHFSHSLFFIPFGAAVAAAVFWLFLRKRMNAAEIYKFAFLGYGTAGLLDACTSYGTRLLWPFSDLRVAWNIISIIDPVYTVPLLGLVLFGVLRRKGLFGKVGLAFAILYPVFGFFQNHRAMGVQGQLLVERGHSDSATMRTVKPSFGNLALWRSIYRVGNVFYVDAIRVDYLGKSSTFSGETIEMAQAEELVLGLSDESALRRDIERFDHFSDHYLVWHPEKENMLCDLRYAFLPHSVEPLWGIEIVYGNSNTHSRFINFRELSEETRSEFLEMLWGNVGDDTI